MGGKAVGKTKITHTCKKHGKFEGELSCTGAPLLNAKFETEKLVDGFKFTVRYALIGSRLPFFLVFFTCVSTFCFRWLHSLVFCFSLSVFVVETSLWPERVKSTTSVTISLPLLFWTWASSTPSPFLLLLESRVFLSVVNASTTSPAARSLSTVLDGNGRKRTSLELLSPSPLTSPTPSLLAIMSRRPSTALGEVLSIMI